MNLAQTRNIRLVQLDRKVMEAFAERADTEEIAPGVRAPGVALTVGRLRASIVETLELGKHGYRPVVPAARVLAPQADGSAITIWADPARTAEGLASRSPEDAAAWVAFDTRVRGFARFIRAIHEATPPDLESPSLADAIAVGVAGVFMETHPDPAKAMSDGPNAVPLHRMRELLSVMRDLDALTKRAGFLENDFN